MENSWQVKCGSTLQSSTPLLASSSSQELRNQVLPRYIFVYLFIFICLCSMFNDMIACSSLEIAHSWLLASSKSEAS